jgi:hypothetical protein
LIFLEQLQSVHPRHVDVRKDHDQLRLDTLAQLLQSVLARVGEMHDIGAGPHLTTKPLAEQLCNIGLVVDHEDANGHTPALVG